MGNAKVKHFLTIPKIKEFSFSDGSLNLPAGKEADEFLESCIDENFCDGDGNNDCEREKYSIDVSPTGVRLTAATEEGLFRARTTFEQLRKNYPRELPCMKIVDWPDFATRGFYHDVTRGRVPTLDTLKQLADTLAFYKINQLQLYVEHSFAFSKLQNLWKDKTPLTREDILELDKYCADRHIELVPSLSTFGHLYELLRLPQYEHLNELDIKASAEKRCLWDRMAHYTLDVNNAESFALVSEMINEYAPLFSSRYFNICCDETFDLGKGKNAAFAKDDDGVGRLYVNFVKKIMGAVRAHGKIPMLWGDIVLKHPQFISELSSGDDGVIFLNWEYTPEVTYEPVKTFKDAGVNQYVCPGVNGWSRFATDVNRACVNISKMARFGFDAGAAGVLNTDWGDCGQVNLLANSYHGLAFGAACSWDVSSCEDNATFDRAFEFLQWGIDENGNLGKLLRELGALCEYHFGNLYAWINAKECLWYKEEDVKKMSIDDLAKKLIRAKEIRAELKKMSEQISNVDCKKEFDEYVFAASATAWLISVLIVKKRYEYQEDIANVPTQIPVSVSQVVNDGCAVAEEFKRLWRLRNRESELRDVVETLLRSALVVQGLGSV